MSYQYLLDTNILSDLVRYPQGRIFHKIASHPCGIRRSVGLGQVDAIRFLQQMGWGHSDYTQERGEILDSVTRE